MCVHRHVIMKSGSKPRCFALQKAVLRAKKFDRSCLKQEGICCTSNSKWGVQCTPQEKVGCMYSLLKAWLQLNGVYTLKWGWWCWHLQHTHLSCFLIVCVWWCDELCIKMFLSGCDLLCHFQSHWAEIWLNWDPRQSWHRLCQAQPMNPH